MSKKIGPMDALFLAVCASSAGAVYKLLSIHLWSTPVLATFSLALWIATLMLWPRARRSDSRDAL